MTEIEKVLAVLFILFILFMLAMAIGLYITYGRD